MSRAVLALAILISSLCPGLAQQFWPTLNFYSGQWSGQVDQRVDGRPNRREGLPPSAADKANWLYENPISPYDCFEVEALKPGARPHYQYRVRRACDEY